MKATELRIGNWVHHEGVWCYRHDEKPVTAFDFEWKEKDWFGVGECLMSLDNLSPIPITPEWLERFGFYKVDHIHGYSFYHNKQHKLSIYEHKTEWCGIALLKHCNSVHSLQNLIFALTGTELTLKP